MLYPIWRRLSCLLNFIVFSAVIAVCTPVFASGPSLSADYNGDGVVDQLDLATWAEGYGCGSSHSEGNGFLDWQQQLGQSAAVTAPVPEAATLAIWAGLGLCAAAVAYRSKRPMAV